MSASNVHQNYHRSREPYFDLSEEVNTASYKIDCINARLDLYRVIISNKEKEMTEIVSISTEVFTIQHEALKKLCGSLDPERFVKINQKIDDQIAEVREIYIQNYISVLENRGSYIDSEGKTILINDQNRPGLIQDYVTIIDQEVKRLRETFKIDEYSDLKNLQKIFSEMIMIRQRQYDQLRREKDNYTDRLYEEDHILGPQIRKHLQEREELFKEGMKVRDIYFASQVNDLHFVRESIRKKIDINKLNDHGFAPLHYAAYSNRIEVVKLLLENDADPLLRDNPAQLTIPSGNLAIHWAAKEGCTAIVRLLLLAKIKGGPFGLFLKRDPEMVNELGEIRTPLHYAAWNKRYETVQFLLANGGSVTKPERSTGMTPIHAAVEMGDMQVIHLLAQRLDFNVMLIDRLGRSVLRYAFESQDIEKVDYMLNHDTFQYIEDPNNLNSLPNMIHLIKTSRYKNVPLFRLLRERQIYYKLQIDRQKQHMEASKKSSEKEKDLRTKGLKGEQLQEELEKTFIEQELLISQRQAEEKQRLDNDLAQEIEEMQNNSD